MARSKSTENTTEKQKFSRAVKAGNVETLEDFIKGGILHDPTKFDTDDKEHALLLAFKKSRSNVVVLLTSNLYFMVGVNVSDALSIACERQDKNMEDLLTRSARQAAETMTAHINGTFNYGFEQYIKDHIIPRLNCSDIDQFANEALALLVGKRGSFQNEFYKEDEDLTLQNLILRAMIEAAKLTNNIRSIFSLEIQQTNILQLAYNLNDHQLILDLLKYKEGRAITVDYNGEKKTPLQKAVLEEDHEMVGYILENMTPEERKQALCTPDSENNTLLHLALDHCCELDKGEVPNTLEELLKYQDDIQEALTTQNNDGETPLYLALHHQLPCFLKLIDKENKVLFLETEVKKSSIGLMCIHDTGDICPFNEVVVRLTCDKIANMMEVELNNGNYENALRIVTVAAKENMMTKDQEDSLINHCMKKHQEASTHGPEDSPSPVATVAPAALVVTSTPPTVTIEATVTHAKAPDLSTMGLY
jgi:hypothetical protein